jgi:serine carboxypeptidase 1
LDPSVKYNSQGGNVGEALYEDFMKSEVRLVEQLLNYHDVQFLVYTGQNDLIVETPGTLRWVERVHYVDSQKFK